MNDKEPTNQQAAPLPCPFCGNNPGTGPTDPKVEGNAWGYVACQGDNCPSQPIVLDGVGVADERGTAAYIAAAVERWNRRAGINSTLESISERLKTQDNRITKNPMFCVQEKRRLVGIDCAYSENRCWHDSANDETIYDDDKDFKGEPEGDEWAEFGYMDQWFTVMVAFTEEGCKEYLRQNGHNHKETRIYVESFNRCPEMIAIRDFLMALKPN